MQAEPSQPQAVITVDGARKSFGAVKALDGVDFSIAQGECVGLVGHNGAGKSTLVSVINGGLPLDGGHVGAGAARIARYSIREARALGVRCVFQELSLCPNLTVTENVRINHADLKGWGWRGRARDLIAKHLDEIFPGHGIDCDSVVGDLSIAQRQMVEIATAFSRHDLPVRVVILDEPTSSLDASRATQLTAYVKSFTRAGGAVIFISHILGEILETADRVVVMRDGRISSEKPADQFTVEGLVQAMGSVAAGQPDRRAIRSHERKDIVVESRRRPGDSHSLLAHRGEIVGLAGLSGHGQTKMLVDLYMRLSSDWRGARDPRAAFVAGDRMVDGAFPLWSILRNMSVTVLPDFVRRGFIDTKAEQEFGASWRDRVGIRTQSLDNFILSLSGGNQQKALFARALGSRADLVLMDDPMRGVDIGTKQDVYAMVRAEADKGRTFIWYSTEMDEVCVCDRVYVFREGRVVSALAGDEVSEANILAASFGAHAA